MGWVLFSVIGQPTFLIKTKIPPGITDILLFQLARSTNRFPGIFLFSYFVTYFLAPFIQKRKFKQFFLFFFISLIALYLITFGSFFLFVDVFHIHPGNWSFFGFLFASYYSNINFTGAISTCCIMLAIKYYKTWYVKQRRSEQLGRENIQAELQLLKAQIHPHFLFNTLNNIYSFVLNKDNRAAGLVDKLAGMIDYMRTEGENSLVPLEKEIGLIKDYIGLEKVRYGDRLTLNVDITSGEQHKLIAPLLMIPFVENSFKHGTSQMLRRPWVKLEITCVGNQLFFNLSNSKPSLTAPGKLNKGIGLNNVKKRLQLLYPGKHQLDIYSTEDSFSVNMQLWLEDKVTVAENKLAQTEKTIVYA